ncbi:MAG: rhomboid family intramembrane serine protease [Candidatus Gracilibacteria bacterium]
MRRIEKNNAPLTKILTVSAIIVTMLTTAEIAGYSNLGLWQYTGIQLNNIIDTIVQGLFMPLRHAGVLHLLGNLLFLWYFGGPIERYIGTYGYFIGYILTLIVTLIGLSLFAQGPTAGMSGFGLALLTFLAMHLTKIHSSEAKGAWVFVVLNIAMGLFGGISLTAHLFGAIGGVMWYLGWRALGSPHTSENLNLPGLSTR